MSRKDFDALYNSLVQLIKRQNEQSDHTRIKSCLAQLQNMIMKNISCLSNKHAFLKTLKGRIEKVNNLSIEFKSFWQENNIKLNTKKIELHLKKELSRIKNEVVNAIKKFYIKKVTFIKYPKVRQPFFSDETYLNNTIFNLKIYFESCLKFLNYS